MRTAAGGPATAVVRPDVACPTSWTGPVLAATRAALGPPGPPRWIVDPLRDGFVLRVAIRRWSTAAEPSARLARVAGGAALRAARLAVATRGRRALVSYPGQAGVLAVVHAGGPAAAAPRELLLHSVLVSRGGGASTGRPPARTAALRALRSAAEAEGAWLRVLPTAAAAGAVLGPAWGEAAGEGVAPGPAAESLVALAGSPGRSAIADLRLGQTVEILLLTATAMGLDLRVLAAPAVLEARDVGRYADPGTDAFALVEVRWPDPSTVRDPAAQRAAGASSGA